jgi:hypothetical protein
MAKFYNGFENIKVELIDYAGNDLAKRVCCFGQHAEFYTGLKSVQDYSEDDAFCKQIVDEIVTGVTFPKYALQGHSVTFSISGISRICLAQFTREGTNDTGTFFCSASSGTRPLTQEQNIPMNIFVRQDWMQRYEKINKDLEALYCDILSEGVPFMDARYIMPHAQTIDICYTASIASFIGSCKKRFDNCIADEVNYLYRLMKNCLTEHVCNEVTDKLSLSLWEWLLKKCDINTYSTNLTYRNDFCRFPLPKDFKFTENAHNDWRKSQWKMELERLYENNPLLLLPGEADMIRTWKECDNLTATYDSTDLFTPEQSIKTMPYYKEIKYD